MPRMKPIVTSKWNPAVRVELEQLFASTVITDARRFERDAARARLNRPKYDTLIKPLGSIPWWFVACVHCLEASFSFEKHLHNGDPLSERTVNEPRFRPLTGKPPYTWWESARDALTMPGKQFHLETDWSIARALWLLEGFNGHGYRLYRGIHSPYLWAGTNHYTKGKYIADGKYDENAVSKQAGVAGLLHLLLSPEQLSQGRES